MALYNKRKKNAFQQGDVNKRTRITLTALQKKELYERMRANPELKQKAIAGLSQIRYFETRKQNVVTGTPIAKQMRSRKPAFIQKSMTQ